MRRRYWWVLIAGLGILLIGLVVALLHELNPSQKSSNEASTGDGVSAVLSITGPGAGAHPRFDRPLSAAFSPDGRIYVSDTGNARICVFDAQGKFLFDFGGSVQTQGSSATVDSSGSIEATSRPSGPRLMSPAGIDIADDGRVYVADARSGRVEVYDLEGRHVDGFRAWPPSSFASTATASSGAEITDVAVSGDTVYIATSNSVVTVAARAYADGSRARAQRFAPGLARPNGVTVSPEGLVYVSDSNRQRVIALTISATLLWASDSTATPGPGAQERASSPAAFGLPRGLAVAVDGTVLVADSLDHRLVRLSAVGALVAYYGEFGSGPGQFEYPNDLDERDGLVLVADKGNNRALVVRLTTRE